MDINQTSVNTENSFKKKITIIKTITGIVLTLAIVIFLVLGDRSRMGTVLGDSMLPHGLISDIGDLGWMWIPGILMLSLFVLFVWVIFGQRK